MTFATEFPDYPSAEMPPIPATWEDVSWRNEQCPSFLTPEGAPRFFVFVDYPEAADREFPESPRFTVHRATDEGEMPEGFNVVSDGDDWSAVLAFILANAFTANLRADLTDAEWSAMRLTNVGIGEGACASHDVRDANMNMAEAFELVIGREPSIGFETHYDAATGRHIADDPEAERRANEDAALWSAAWEIATPRYLTAPVVDYAAPVAGALVEYQNGQMATVAAVIGDGFAVLHAPDYSEAGDWIPARLELVEGEERLAFVSDDEDAVFTLADAIRIATDAKGA